MDTTRLVPNCIPIYFNLYFCSLINYKLSKYTIMDGVWRIKDGWLFIFPEVFKYLITQLGMYYKSIFFSKNIPEMGVYIMSKSVWTRLFRVVTHSYPDRQSSYYHHKPKQTVSVVLVGTYDLYSVVVGWRVDDIIICSMIAEVTICQLLCVPMIIYNMFQNSCNSGKILFYL